MDTLDDEVDLRTWPEHSSHDIMNKQPTGRSILRMSKLILFLNP